MPFRKYSKTFRYRHIIEAVIQNTRYVGQDENDMPLYDNTIKLPTIKFTGTVKLHGQNCAIGYDSKTDELWYQTRNQEITKDKNHSFTQWANKNKEYLKENIKKYKVVSEDSQVVVYGEWCGGNIQNGVAISGLEKMFVVFGLRIFFGDVKVWGDHSLFPSKHSIQLYNTTEFKTYNIEIDFNRPEDYQQTLTDLTNEVETECPVGKFFERKLGEDNTTGEGIVWVSSNHSYIFKTKGLKHETSKSNRAPDITPEIMSSILEFVEYSVTHNRLSQALDEVFGYSPASIKGTGDFIRWVIKDIIEEERDVLEKSNLDVKVINKYISKAASRWFMEYLDNPSEGTR